MRDLNKALQFMIDTANDNTKGYDQQHRNSPNYDCSSLVGTALNFAGFPVSKFSWTGNILTQLLNCGFKVVAINDKRLAGDIFLTPGKHVVMCTDWNNIVHASINEKGTVTGGKSGDQTGKEICMRSFYTPSYGWKYHLRYVPTTPAQCYPTYVGNSTSIVDSLKAVGCDDTSYTHRFKIATKNNIIGYKGSSSQNLKLMELLKKGKLEKA